MKGTFLCVMASFDPQTDEKLDVIRASLKQAGFKGRQSKNLPNHITLGIYEPDMEELLISRINEIADSFDSISLTLGNIGLFGLRVAFIAPVVNHRLLEIHEALPSNEEPWSPHVTMLIEDDEVILKALPIIKESFIPFEATISSICLYQFKPTRFILKRELKLICKI